MHYSLFIWLPPYRKKVLDFYQRACLSGYCSAFAYKPMQVSLSNQLNGKCVELAPGPNLFSGVELPSTTPIKYDSHRNSWSSDGKGRGERVGRENDAATLTMCFVLYLSVTFAFIFIFCPPPFSLSPLTSLHRGYRRRCGEG
jgi:hypothetical protein